MAMRYARKITVLFVGNEPMNAWAYLVDVGWMKFREDNADAHTNMVTVATHAKADNRFVDIYEDPVGFISQIYVF